MSGTLFNLPDAPLAKPSSVPLSILLRMFSLQHSHYKLVQQLISSLYRCLGIESRKGTLRAGADADLVRLDSAGNVKATWVAGKKVWEE